MTNTRPRQDRTKTEEDKAEYLKYETQHRPNTTKTEHNGDDKKKQRQNTTMTEYGKDRTEQRPSTKKTQQY